MRTIDRLPRAHSAAGRSLGLAFILLVMSSGGCGKAVKVAEVNPGSSKTAGDTVVVYSALDQEFAEPVLRDLGKEAGMQVLSKFDIESTKTVGLTTGIIAEAGRPRCDLFWNNEILNTLRLKDKGLLQPYRPQHAGDLPEAFKDADGLWYGFAARGRILLINTRLVPQADRPSGLTDLVNSRWKGKIGIAKPLFGTTATHAACLFAAWGDDKARKFFRDLKANDVQVLSGNKQVATAVGAGQIAVGLTDTDDAMGEIEAGSPVAIVYPDRQAGQLGTLFIPNTLAMIKDAPHPQAAARLADLILSPEVEASLADGPSAQIPILSSTRKPARVETPASVHPMVVDFQKAAQVWDRVAAFLTAEFEG